MFRITSKLLAYSLIVLILPFSYINNAAARNSAFTQKGTGPLAWSTYHMQLCGTFTDANFETQINWFADSLKPFGYTMIITDGGLGNLTYNSNGYITKFNAGGTRSISDWVTYCNNKGLNLGIYFNPLWLPAAARNNANCKVIGTNNSVSGLTNAGDKFNDNPGEDIYWIDVTKTDAEAYLKGYITYFKNLGVKLLRIDFLCVYENGQENRVAGYVPHGRNDYETALRWMEEAAGDDIELSLVMPLLLKDNDPDHPNAELELKYGDMIRINDDTRGGGWNHFSEGISCHQAPQTQPACVPVPASTRGQLNGRWSQYNSTFDGFIYWSQFTGKNKMIMDGDFLWIASFADQNEKQSAISLYALAGAPTIVMDLNTISNTDLAYYKNIDLLNLNQQGFVAKPIKSDVSDSYNSQRWIGMQADGSWVAGLFNRETSAQFRNVHFAIDLGINGTAQVQDLWTKQNLGTMSEYTQNIESHACKVVKITPNNPQINNGGFETRDISGWTEWHPTGQNPCFGVDNNDCYTGQNKLYFWSGSAYSQSVHQVKTGLISSALYTYEVTAKIKTYGNTPNKCRMEVVGASTIYYNTGINNEWRSYSIGKLHAKSDGSLDIGFYINSPGGSSMQIDDVQLHCYYYISQTGTYVMLY